MTRTLVVAFCCLCIFVTCVDDSIAAWTVTMDDVYAAAADNDYLSDQPTTQLVEGQLQLIALCASNFTSLAATRRAAAAVAAHLPFEARDVFPLIMQC
jgi:hypothetical protein